MTEPLWAWWQNSQRFHAAVAEAIGESKDGNGAGDHDEPYRYVRLTTACHMPFNEHQFARLLMLRGLVQDNRVTEDDYERG